MIETRIVKSKYPCCERPARFRALPIPHERYIRRCSDEYGETVWSVDRRTMTITDGPMAGAVVDVLTWTDEALKSYRQKYGS